jgi:hypothetical protein
MHQRLSGLRLLSRFAVEGRIVENLAAAAELADTWVVVATDMAGLFGRWLAGFWFDWSWYSFSVSLWISWGEVVGVVGMTLWFAWDGLGAMMFVFERFSVEVGIGQFSIAGRARHVVLIEPMGYLGFLDGILCGGTANVSVYRSSWD